MKFDRTKTSCYITATLLVTNDEGCVLLLIQFNHQMYAAEEAVNEGFVHVITAKAVAEVADGVVVAFLCYID